MYANIMNLDDEEIKDLKIHMVDLPTGTSSSIAALQEVKEKLRFEAFCYTADKNHFHPVPGGVVLPDLQVNVRNINYSQLLRYVAIKAEFVADIVFVVEGVSCSTWSNMNVINGTTSIPVMTDMSRQIKMKTMNNHLKMADVKGVSRWHTVKCASETDMNNLTEGMYEVESMGEDWKGEAKKIVKVQRKNLEKGV